MSLRPVLDPACSKSRERVVATVIDARTRDLDGVEVRRALPSITLRMVGPFTFFDQMGAGKLDLLGRSADGARTAGEVISTRWVE